MMQRRPCLAPSSDQRRATGRGGLHSTRLARSQLGGVTAAEGQGVFVGIRAAEGPDKAAQEKMRELLGEGLHSRAAGLRGSPVRRRPHTKQRQRTRRGTSLGDARGRDSTSCSPRSSGPDVNGLGARDPGAKTESSTDSDRHRGDGSRPPCQHWRHSPGSETRACLSVLRRQPVHNLVEDDSRLQNAASCAWPRTPKSTTVNGVYPD